MKALRDCEFASKFQIEESANSSAVISDCLALKVPVITLRNTEAYRSISGFFDDLVMNSISGAELQRVVQNFTGFDEIAIDRELRNRRGQLIEGVLGKC
jgi:hypothetical protein